MENKYYFPKIEKWKLDNGMTVVWSPRKEINSAYIYAFVKFGSANEPSEYPGMAHFLEHLVLFSPTKSFPAQNSIDAFSQKLGGLPQGLTALSRIEFCNNYLPDSFLNAIKLFKEILFFSTLSPRSISSERERIIQEIAEQRDDPSEYLNDLVYQTRAREKNSCLRSVLGNKNSVQKIRRKDLEVTYKENFVPENILLTISGPAYLKKDLQKSLQEFESIPSSNKPTLRWRKTSSSGVSCSHTYHPSAEQLYFGISFPLVPIDPIELHKIFLLDDLIESLEKSPLAKIRKKGLVYSISSHYPLLPEQSFFYVTGSAQKYSSFQKILSALLEDLNQTRKAPSFLKEDLFEDAKRRAIHSVFVDAESIDDFLTSLGLYFTLTGEIVSPQEEIRRIEGTTIEEMTELTQRFFPNRDINIITVSNDKKLPEEIS